MFSRLRLCLSNATIVTALFFGMTTTARADAEADFLRLVDKFTEQYGGGDYSKAGQTALAMRQLAEGPLKSRRDFVILAVKYQGWVCQHQGRYAAAETLLKWVMTAAKKEWGIENSGTTAALNDLAMLYLDQGRYSEAEPLCAQALAVRERMFGKDHPKTLVNLNNLASVYTSQGRYAEAETLHRRALALREKLLGNDHLDVAASLNNLALLYGKQGRYTEAEPLFKRARGIHEKTLGLEHPSVALSLNNLAGLYEQQGRFAAAEPLYKRALAIRKKAFGEEHPTTATSLDNLALLYHSLGRYAEAELLCREALEIRGSVLGDEHPSTSLSLNNLGAFYDDQGRYAEAESLYRRSLAICEKVHGRNHPATALCLNNLATLSQDQGRYAEAVLLQNRALAIRSKTLGKDHPDTATSLNNLALVYKEQGRYSEADQLYQRSLKIRESRLGRKHPDTIVSLNNLATLYGKLGRYTEAEMLCKRAIAIREEVLGRDHPDTALSLNNLALLYYDLDRYPEAEPLIRRALAIWEKTLGSEHPQMALGLHNLAWLHLCQEKYTEAKPLADRAIAISDLVRVVPGDRSNRYNLRASVCWKMGRKREALDDLKVAMKLAEFQRGYAAGAAQERATFFVKFMDAFERMVEWQTELGDICEALSAMERSRARSLIDQMTTQGIDLLAGVHKEEANSLRSREREARRRIAAIEKQLQALNECMGISSQERQVERERCYEKLCKARDDYRRVYSDIRNASPAYQLAIRKDRSPVPVDELASWVADQRALFLEYVVGREGSYLLVVPARDKPCLVRLIVDGNQAQQLGIESGPLTARTLKNALTKSDGTGILQCLRIADAPKKAQLSCSELNSLWNVLIPEAEREAILDGEYKRLVVVPDGQLALLPFETLVVEPGDKPKYLLDVGPPIYYAPSATVLHNLDQRQSEAVPSDREPVLTIGNPKYGTEKASGGKASILNQLKPSSRYGTLGGKLTELPYSDWEAQWIKDVYGKSGIKVVKLVADNATERNVRDQISGRRVVHLACHGLADQSHGNFFGALALAPGKDAKDSADDGFLTLPEIYELDLKSCELAILSACDTNFGPEQRGEGVWALSRGFLVAGARRVIASNWLVDDEAAASLISYTCSILAKAEKNGEELDYAAALHKSKKWVRGQEKWSSPYYWGTFVLVGPK